MDKAAIPGRMRGSTICDHVLRREQPSMRADISMSQETRSKNPFMVQMPKGRSNATLTMITPIMVP